VNKALPRSNGTTTPQRLRLRPRGIIGKRRKLLRRRPLGGWTGAQHGRAGAQQTGSEMTKEEAMYFRKRCISWAWWERSCSAGFSTP
jgi:hypothetical protein